MFDALDTPIAYVLTDGGQAGACAWDGGEDCSRGPGKGWDGQLLAQWNRARALRNGHGFCLSVPRGEAYDPDCMNPSEGCPMKPTPCDHRWKQAQESAVRDAPDALPNWFCDRCGLVPGPGGVLDEARDVIEEADPCERLDGATGAETRGVRCRPSTRPGAR